MLQQLLRLLFPTASLLVLHWLQRIDAFSLVSPHHRSGHVHHGSSSSRSIFSQERPFVASPWMQQTVSDRGNQVLTDREVLKAELLRAVTNFRNIQEQDGTVSIDFGVKGGELNATNRAPQKVDYYAVSPRLGQAADAIIDVCHRLQGTNPTDNPTKFLGDKVNGADCPLHGTWKLLFTTAADASFSKNSTRGDATAQNVVDATRGTVTNVIDFKTDRKGNPPVLKQLNVVIKAKAESPTRVGLNFRYAKAKLTKFFFLPIPWTLYIPVPATFITRLIVFTYRIFRRKKAKVPPKAYFDVLYLDDDLRIHKTGEDNWFVQARPSWSAASHLLI